MKNSDMPAMPQIITDSNDGSGLVGSHMEDEWIGLTKREMFAIKLMAAYRTQHEVLGVKPGEVAKWAVEDADALFKELEK